MPQDRRALQREDSDTTRRRARKLGALRTALAGVLALGALGVGVTAWEDHQLEPAEALPTLVDALTEEPAPAPPEAQPIPVVEPREGSSSPTEPHLVVETPVEHEEPAESHAAEGQSDGEAPVEQPAPMIVTAEKVPEGGATTLRAGGSTQTVATASGTGTITLGFTRTASSAAPNLPTYVSSICDGASVYSGAFNTTTQGPVVQDVPYAGANCSIQVRVAQPSDRWTGTTSSVVVTRDQPEAATHGSTYVEKADWTTTAVSGEDTFFLDVPEGFTGTVSLKLTACSSQGGTSDQTKRYACGDLVQKGVGSEGSITISDGEQVLAATGFDITAETHHDMVTVDIDEPAADDLVIDVERSGGSAVLVHGPGTSAVGTH